MIIVKYSFKWSFVVLLLVPPPDAVESRGQKRLEATPLISAKSESNILPTVSTASPADLVC